MPRSQSSNKQDKEKNLSFTALVALVLSLLWLNLVVMSWPVFWNDNVITMTGILIFGIVGAFVIEHRKSEDFRKQLPAITGGIVMAGIMVALLVLLANGME